MTNYHLFVHKYLLSSCILSKEVQVNDYRAFFFFFLKTVNKIYCFNDDPKKTMLNPKRWQAIVSSPYKCIFLEDCT